MGSIPYLKKSHFDSNFGKGMNEDFCLQDQGLWYTDTLDEGPVITWGF